MEPILLILMLALGAVGGGGTIMAINRRSAKPAASPPAPANATSESPKQETDIALVSERAQLYYERSRLVHRWQAVLNHFQGYIERATTIEEMAQGFARAICQEFAETGVVVAMGPLKDIVLLHATPGSKRHIDLHTGSYILTRPKLDVDLAYELAETLYNAAKSRQPDGKRWWLLREISPNLQEMLHKRFQLPGHGLLVPLWVNDVIYGLVLITNIQMAPDPNSARDNGEFATLIANMIAIWVRCTAPHILTGNAANPSTLLPIDMLVAFESVEKATEVLRDVTVDPKSMNEVAAYSHFTLTSAAEITLVAEQACVSLARICQADFAMALLPTAQSGQSNFMVEAMQIDDWTWSRFQALQGLQPEHPVITIGQLQAPWLDAFVRVAGERGQIVHATTFAEVCKEARQMSELHMQSLLAIPVQLEGKCQAIFVIGMQEPGGFTEQMLMVASAIVSITAMSLHMVAVAAERNDTYRALDDAWKLASAITAQALTALTSIATAHGTLTASHPQRVATLAEQMARQLRLTPLEVYHIRIAALMCDIGTVAIPAAILLKEGDLTSEERKIIEEHPLVSAQILGDMPVFKDALGFIRSHHERWDGSGYPDHLVGATIPLGARIIGVADVYIALQSPRPYRDAFTPAQALSQIQAAAGQIFDPNVVRTLTFLVKDAKPEIDAAA